MTVFHRDKEFEIWSTRGEKFVAQTNREHRNKGFFEFIARQVIGLHRADHFLPPFFLAKFDSRDIFSSAIKRKLLDDVTSRATRTPSATRSRRKL